MTGVAFWADRPVLLTGAGGYLGRALATELATHGARVMGSALVDPRPAEGLTEVVLGDLREPGRVRDVLQRHAIRTCFHLAGQAGVAESEADPVRAFETNCRATWCLLEACRLAGGLDETGVAPGHQGYRAQAAAPFPEDPPLYGFGIYAAPKACADG